MEILEHIMYFLFVICPSGVATFFGLLYFPAWLWNKRRSRLYYEAKSDEVDHTAIELEEEIKRKAARIEENQRRQEAGHYDYIGD